MGRRTETARHADKLDQAAADAAALMSANIAKIGGQMEGFLLAARNCTNQGQRTYLFSHVGELIDAQVKLGQTIAKMRGEIRQRISVHKTSASAANHAANAPKSAPNFTAASHKNSSESADMVGKNPSGPPGEGEGPQAEPLETWQSRIPPLSKEVQQFVAARRAERQSQQRQSPDADVEKG